MSAVQFLAEGVRALQHDDVATFLFAGSGLDETAATSDDYTVNVVYRGRTVEGCNVLIEDLPPDAPPSIGGLCEAEAIGIGGADQHFRIAGLARIQMAVDESWYYGAEVFSSGFESGDLSDWD